MSELKAYTYDDMLDGNADVDVKYYLKEDADNVIAELKKEIEEQKRLRDMALASVPNVLKVMKIIRHHQFKRCLAMARIAQDDWHLHNSFYAMGHQEFEKRKCDFYDKWHKRWLAIAEKFKPNSTLQQKD